MVYASSLIFTFLVTVLTYEAWSDWSTWKLNFVKYGLIISYAVLIRQLVICPCCLVRAYGLQHSLYTDAKSEEGRRAGKMLQLFKRAKFGVGDVILDLIFVLHIFMLLATVGLMFTTYSDDHPGDIIAKTLWQVRWVP